MVNDVILNYLKETKDKFPIGRIKEKILSSGYSEAEFNDALNSLGVSPPQSLTPQVQETQTPIKKQGGIKWMFFAGIAGFILLAANLIVSVLELLGRGIFSKDLSLTVPIIISIVVGSLLAIFYFVGFLKLGKATNSKLLKFSAIANLSTIILLAANLFWIQNLFGEVVSNIDGQVFSGFPSSTQYLLMATGALLFILYIFRTLFNISLIRISHHFKTALWTGIVGLLVTFLSFAMVVYTLYLMFTPEALVAFTLNPSMISTANISWKALHYLIGLAILLESITLILASKRFE